jgi:hypothetical protein
VPFLLSFVTFLGPSNGFLQNNNVYLIEIEGKQVHTLESSIAYWKKLNIAWPQQKPAKNVDNFKTSYDM